MILGSMEADDPRWAESLHIPNLHDHLQAAKNGTEFSDVVMDSASQKTFTRLYRRVHYRWLLLKTNFHIHLHPMKKISYFAIVLLILFFLYALISTILTRHPATPNHQAIALHPATEGERHALMKAQEEDEFPLQTQKSLVPLMPPTAAEKTVLNMQQR